MTIGFIGTGNMGGALMQALAPHYPLCACSRGRDKLLRVCEATGAAPMDSIDAVAAASDLLVLAVKPNVIPTVLEQLAPVVRPETIVVSVAAIPQRIVHHLPSDKGEQQKCYIVVIFVHIFREQLAQGPAQNRHYGLEASEEQRDYRRRFIINALHFKP